MVPYVPGSSLFRPNPRTSDVGRPERGGVSLGHDLATDLAWLQFRESRLLAAIALAQAAGGGWQTALP